MKVKPQNGSLSI